MGILVQEFIWGFRLRSTVWGDWCRSLVLGALAVPDLGLAVWDLIWTSVLVSGWAAQARCSS